MIEKLGKLAIPKDFNENLDALKEKSFNWGMLYTSQTELGATGNITHYSASDNPRGNFILLPGLASNTSIEPLMKSITFWALRANYNVYCLNTFLGDFKPEVSTEHANKNTYAEFIKLVDSGLDIIEYKISGKWTCLIGHSAGCSAAIDIFNNRVKEGKKLRFSSSILFAPNVSKEWHKSMKDMYRNRYNLEHLSNEEFNKTPMGIMSPHNLSINEKPQYISILPTLLDDLDERHFNPYLMNKWNVPVTMVAGGKDRKAPIDKLRRMVNVLSKRSNTNNFKLVEFPDSKHSFINQHRDWEAIINLIKSQRVKHRTIK
ncbi:MAG: alpha/beta hydrolase [Alphaproteobacteria bacterium]|nr:alpha/beta hydrolase [Alphaproteobacteria bacterium]MBN2675423.1 alpha/beta hydrolase [Alphaproteobacteria bacterium]